METVLSEMKPLVCVMSAEKCYGRYHDSDLKQILTEQQYAKYVELSHIEVTVGMTKILDNYHMCPFCSKYGIIIDNLDNIPQKDAWVQCGTCLKKWCMKCRLEAHVPDPCGKITTSNRDAIRKIIEQAIDESSIHKCPKCNIKYNKEDGCNLMYCSTCCTYSCYICNAIIVPKDGKNYRHFKGSGSADASAVCPLYNTDDSITDENVRKGNKQYDDKRIIKAIEDLFLRNKGVNESILTIMCEETEKMGYDMTTNRTVTDAFGKYKMNRIKKVKPVVSSTKKSNDDCWIM
jgi:hypothetical protein